MAQYSFVTNNFHCYGHVMPFGKIFGYLKDIRLVGEKPIRKRDVEKNFKSKALVSSIAIRDVRR